MNIRKYLNRKHVNPLYLLKTGIGSAIAIIIANFFGLAYSPSAGIITLLTIQNTKKETIFIALKRILSFILAIIIAAVLFTSIGYSSITFGLFIIIFVALSILFGLQDGISMNAVLTTHFLIEERMDMAFIMNEVGILLIGMWIGILLNLIMPRTKEKIRRNQIELEDLMRITLKSLADRLLNKDDLAIDICKTEELPRLEQMVVNLLEEAYEDAGNTLLSNTRYLISYLEMRRLQISQLRNILSTMDRIPGIIPQAIPIANYMNNIAETFHEMNNVQGLLEELEELYQYYRKEALPKTREEFENRAVLFQILKELDDFLLLKRNFVINLDQKDLKSYW